MSPLSLLFLALAVSIDSFGAGLTYGLRKVKITISGCFILALCSGAVLYFSALLGLAANRVLPENASQMIGGFSFVLLGVWALWQILRERKASPQEKKDEQRERILLKFEVKTLGLVIHILKLPTAADLDRSGTIRGMEAVLLGIALSVDAFGAGFGAAMLGLPPLGLACVTGFMSALFVYLGIWAGKGIAKAGWMGRLTFLPGIILILYGLWRLSRPFRHPAN